MLAVETQDQTLQQLEAAEAAAWGDLYTSPRAGLADSTGIRLIHYGKAVISIAAKADILALNRVIGFGSENYVTPEDIEWLKGVYRKAKVRRFFVQVSPNEADELPTFLEQAGFRYHNNWVKLHRNTAPLIQNGNGLHVHRIGGKNAEIFGGIVAEGFDWPGYAVEWMASLANRENWQCYVACDGEAPIAAAAMYFHDRTAWIGFAATLKNHRGKGAQAALTSRRISDAAAKGASIIAVETGEDRPGHSVPSHRNMVRFGFSEAYKIRNFIYDFE